MPFIPRIKVITDDGLIIEDINLFAERYDTLAPNIILPEPTDGDTLFDIITRLCERENVIGSISFHNCHHTNGELAINSCRNSQYSFEEIILDGT